MASADFCIVTATIAGRRAVNLHDVAASFFDTQRAARHGAGSWCPGANHSGLCRHPGAPLAAQISHCQGRELSVHRRPIYLERRTDVPCCLVPAFLDPPGLLCGFCSSSRTFALRLPPDQPSRVSPSGIVARRLRTRRRLVVDIALMSPIRFSHRGLAPHQFAPMRGAHRRFRSRQARSNLFR